MTSAQLDPAADQEARVEADDLGLRLLGMVAVGLIALQYAARLAVTVDRGGPAAFFDVVVAASFFLAVVVAWRAARRGSYWLTLGSFLGWAALASARSVTFYDEQLNELGIDNDDATTPTLIVVSILVLAFLYSLTVYGGARPRFFPLIMGSGLQAAHAIALLLTLAGEPSYARVPDWYLQVWGWLPALSWGPLAVVAVGLAWSRAGSKP